MPDLAARQMFMIMFMLIKSEARGRMIAKQRFELLAGGNAGRCAGATDMAIQAYHMIRG